MRDEIAEPQRPAVPADDADPPPAPARPQYDAAPATFTWEELVDAYTPWGMRQGD